jgi:hypothetical protein
MFWQMVSPAAVTAPQMLRVTPEACMAPGGQGRAASAGVSHSVAVIG